MAASPAAEHRLWRLGRQSCRPWAQCCGACAQLPHSLWDLPGPGMEPLSPALRGGFLTTGPPGKPWTFLYFASWAGFRADPEVWLTAIFISATAFSLSLFKFFKGETVILEDSLHFFREPTFSCHPAFVPHPNSCAFSLVCVRNESSQGPQASRISLSYLHCENNLGASPRGMNCVFIR